MRAVALTSLVMLGCVPSSQELRAPVDRLVSERLGGDSPRQAALSDGELDRLLAQPLDRQTAIRIALARSPRLQATFDQLAIAGGDVAAALGLGPLTVEAKARIGLPEDEYELDAIQSLMGLISAPGRRAAANAELSAARAMAAAGALRLAARVDIAFDDLLAAQQDVALRQAAFDAADAGATLRERMHAAGNTTDLALARDRDAREQARIDLTRATAAAAARHEAVTGLLGLSGARTTWAAGGELRELPAAPPALDALEPTAEAASLELAAGRDRRAAADHRASTERLRAVIPALGVGVAVAADHDTSQVGIGPAVQLGIPLFDQRAGERARANAQVERADHELAAEAVELGAAARAARITALATYDEARRLHDVVLPLRQQIVDETLAHYNAMDADPFALIMARRELADGAHQYLDATRRYWNAMVEVSALSRGVMLAPMSDAGQTAEPPGMSEVP
jgi:cobalt-zinc-cadmium efflux system outer membrane protein